MFYLAGEWRHGDETFDVTSPYDGRVVETVARPGPIEADMALVEAVAAFEVMRTLPAHVRADALVHISNRIEERVEEFARITTDEVGKPLKAARVEALRAASTFRWAAEEARRHDGEFRRADTLPGAEGRATLVQYMPRGVVFAITGFNFPMILVAHKVAPALAVGCPIIVKPAQATPLTALLIAEIVRETELPRGALSVLPLRSHDAETLVTDDRVSVVSFTGSSAVGWKLKEKAFRKQVTLELGGNGAVIVHDDADLDLVAEKVATGGFGNTGQSCNSAQRILIHERVYEEATAKIVARVEHLVVGDPADPETDVGPLIDTDAVERIGKWVDEAVGLGAKVLTGGRRDGPIFLPTVLAEVPHHASAWCEEIFGPVVLLEPYGTFEEAIKLANESSYGLQAGVFTNDARRLFLAFRELAVGGVIANDTSNWRADQMPYGGVKNSGFGREGIRYAMEEMCEPKVLAFSGLPL
jgi:acyl-CoA reductase-like NAD-dependent aldehyde dehydrogenase